MASGKSSYLKNAIINEILGDTAFTVPTTLYVALSTGMWAASTTGSSISEPSGGGYARVSITNDSTMWPVTTIGSKSNAVAITFPLASANWGTVQSFYLVDASSGGNILYGGDLYTPRAVLSGDTPKFNIGQMTVTEA